MTKRSISAGDEQRWSGIATAYERSFARLCAYPAARLLDATGAMPGRRLLDVGTGTGTVAVLAAERGASVVAVDPDEDMLAVARPKDSRVTYVNAALPLLPFPDAAFHAVTANFVINHVGDPRAALAEMVRVTRPKGILAVTIWPYPVSPLHQLFAEAVDASAAILPPSHRLPTGLDFSRTEAGLADLLTAAGLRDVGASRLSWECRVDPEEWWAGPAGGVATIGEIVTSQSPQIAAAIKANYDRLTRGYRDGDELVLPTAAILAFGIRR